MFAGICKWLKTFFIINDKSFHSKDKDAAIAHLTVAIDSYLTDGDTSIYSEMYLALNCSGKIFSKSLSYLGHLQSPLNDFNEAVADFTELHKNTLFKQGLIEFNNALSHLFAGFSSSDTNFEKNISKACTHLHRGSLDYYKTLIKNKESLTHSQKQELIRIREMEIKSIGLEVSNNNKDEILDEYRKLARKLHGITK